MSKRSLHSAQAVAASCLVLSTAFCTPSSQPVTDVPTRYKYLSEGSITPEDIDKTWADLPFDSISLTRRPCGVALPSGTVVLGKHGYARFGGCGEDTSTKGPHGDVDMLFLYGSLSYLVERLDLDRSLGSYSTPRTDELLVILEIFPTGSSQPIVIRDYGQSGPIELWGVAWAIQGIAEHLESMPE